MSLDPIAVYVHTPFCPSKCGYCDFNSYAMSGQVVERTVLATIREIERSPMQGRPAKTIFLGGGTPTFLAETQLLRILDAVFEAHPPLAGAEVTSEANPGTVDMPKFRAMRKHGFNRISLGAQSFLDEDLITLGRVHQSKHIEGAVRTARNAGFDNLNLDLMFALPKQTHHAWRRNLDRALALLPEHLSLYCLTIEPNTPFYKMSLHGLLDLPSEDAQVAMYEECLDRTASAGMAQYEISNFAKPRRECKHNLCYWRGEEYVGYGPGAVGCISGVDGKESAERVRYTNIKHPERYCAAIEAGEPAAYDLEPLSSETLALERVMLGLRLDEGLEVRALDRNSISSLVQKGWLQVDSGRARLTRAGKHFCSEAALALI